ncbi:hypothetical protein AB0442_03220 [Kitasatospora sp. NPDC085895]|uniref:hypothetical protein n=1 Tax=Kitasatospora sp. NPDC085895 TaxID=3155057 RepID=UPI00344DE4FA
MTRAAVRAFVAAHSGSDQEAEAEIRGVIATFLTDGRQAQQTDGYRLVDLNGYRFVLSHDGTALTGYRSMHGERSPAQYLAGVPSRYRFSRLAVTDRGPALQDVAAVRALPVEQIQVSAETRSAFADLTSDRPDQTDVFLDRLRNALAADLSGGHIETQPRGNHLVLGSSRTWNLSPDGSSVLFVRRPTPLDAETLAAVGLGEADELAPGTELRVRALAHGDHFHWRVTPVPEDRQRRYLLKLRPDDRVPGAGQELDVWVVRRRSGVYVVSASDFGRHEISERSAERCRSALTVLTAIGGDSPTEPPHASVLALDGLVSCCFRRDQADWLSVWRLLGSPSSADLTVLRDISRNLPDAVQSADATELEQLGEVLQSSGWLDRAIAALAKLAGKDSPEVSSVAAPATVLTAELAAAAETDRTCLQHEAVRHQLMAALFGAGHKPQDSSIVDVLRPGEQGPIVYEVLPAGHTSYHAVRSGAVRVREIGQVVGGTPERLHVVLTSPPDEPWIPDLVERVLGISVLWPSASGWQGPGSSSATDD